jgi:hypothetical protein
VIPIILIGIVFLVKAVLGVDDPSYRELTKEDNLIENLTAFAYFLAFGFSILVLKNVKKNKVVFSIFIVLSVMFLVVGLEEISYGQRIVGFVNPDIQSENYQGEINIHNLDSIQPYRYIFYITISFLGAFSWLIFPKITKNKMFIKCLPPKFLFSYFISVLIMYIVMKSAPLQFRSLHVIDDFLIPVTYGFFIRHDSEFFEMILGLGLMFFAINSWLVVSSQSPEDRKEGKK